MARGAAATQPGDGDAQQGESKGSKRRCVQSACVPCRKRKSKCDGATPFCATCTAVYKTPCHYDAESESRRSKSSSAASAGTKREASAAVVSHTGDALTIDSLINSIRSLPEENVLDFIQQIRRDPKADTVALLHSWHSTTLALPQPSSPFDVQSLESDLSVLLGKPAITLTGQSRHFGHSASLGLVTEDEDYGGGLARMHTADAQRRGTTWTRVTDDLAFVNRLLTLYFTWSHPFYILFSRESFYKDFQEGRNKYCSSLLVNAICAYASHLTDEPAARTNPANFRTAGDHFFAEAKRLLQEDDTSNLTTTQALCLMAMREPSTGRDSAGFGYIGRCIRMCVELGLHLNNSASPALGLTPSEIEVRKVTFWGCFTVDTVWSICAGRIAQLPRAAITLDKPILEESSGPLEASHGASKVITTRMFLQEFSALSEMINDNNHMFFAPKERLTSTKLLDCYNKYQAWYRKLPSIMRLEGRQPEPHTITLHMLYWTVIVHLFRPVLKVDFIHSDVHPRDKCIEAANKVSGLTRLYRSLYDFRTAHLAIPHILLSVTIVHLLYSKDNPTSRQNLVEGLQGLEALHECHYFGARSFRIIHSLARTWNLPWPEELENSKLVPRSDPNNPRGAASPPADPLLVAPNTVTLVNRKGPGGYSQIPEPDRRGSLSMFANMNMQPNPHNKARSGSVVPSQHHGSPTVSTTSPQPAFSAGMPMGSYTSYSQSMSMAIPTTSTATSEAADAMFWTPIAGMPAPILPRVNYQQISPMGLDSVLHTGNMGDRLGRDGFKINEEWQQTGVNGYVSSAPGYEHGQAGGSYPVSYQRGGHGAQDGQAQEHFDTSWWHNSAGNSNAMS
ncbi:fungal-specific transcription factor domain-containing protein [Boeremia exigua]|uniref:fungal-specific transcription factor domain-containing protein n=1 Tax=Boeremia exigua TaxID=749465 RepID=UPI001E8DA513|nr:fungal-specific transcription factor domain-containing protein [Boeremia exigua]KAH6639493.1 fungal-specific transcription factor domain-containing protein [Boeremia exigua]